MHHDALISAAAVVAASGASTHLQALQSGCFLKQ
jgi:hypothetical protein